LGWEEKENGINLAAKDKIEYTEHKEKDEWR
jgi:hypothetical protein